jgi:hypothetical protein
MAENGSSMAASVAVIMWHGGEVRNGVMAASAAKYRRGENGRNRNSITINIIEENRDLAKENRRKKRK